MVRWYKDNVDGRIVATRIFEDKQNIEVEGKVVEDGVVLYRDSVSFDKAECYLDGEIIKEIDMLESKIHRFARKDDETLDKVRDRVEYHME